MRIMQTIVLLILWAVGACAQNFTVVCWNVESGDADPQVIATRIEQYQGSDLWGEIAFLHKRQW